MYVIQLSKAEQAAILKKIRLHLENEGLDEREIRRALVNAKDSKLSDIDYLI